ncbi:MAG: hypothetical protein PHE27_07775, partial [Alphaproteobacteria bacterium]|nr:hypothetical protein [Alphaproteobacteria bacterium]
SNIKVPMRAVLSVIAGLAGLYMIISGLMKASKAGLDPKTHNPHVILTNVGFGAILMMIGTNLTTLLGSVFGTEEILELSNISWNTPVPEASQQFNNAINAALTFVQIIGGIAFVRGWLILKKVVEGTTNDPLAKALTHILGGCLAINIGKFLEIMDATFGTNLLTSA